MICTDITHINDASCVIMYIYITKIFFVQNSLKQQNEVNGRKGWSVIRNEVAIEKLEKKLNQVMDEMKKEMIRQRQEMEQQRKSEMKEMKCVLQEMQRCVANINNMSSNSA